ncbi:MAG: hypothetical protein ACF8R9_09380 [Phycisphaerales bacterium JB054]
MSARVERLKTGVLVTLIAVLIWAFAEGQSLRSQRTVVELEFSPLSNGVWATRVVDGQDWRGRVEVLVEGSVTSLDSLEAILREPVSFEPGMEGLPRATGEHTMELRESLRLHPEFRSRGVSVLSAEPATVRVHVQELATLSLPIRVEAPSAELDGVAELVGVSEATVRLPAEMAAALEPGAAWMVAQVDPSQLAALQEGVRSILRVRLVPGSVLDRDSVFSVEPAQVDVRLTVRSKTESHVLVSVPVDLRLPAGELGRFDVTIPPEAQALSNVTVKGPSELIQRIRDGQLVVRAYIRLTYEELEAGVTSKRAEFSGYPVALSFEVEDPDVSVEIHRREPGPNGGDGAAGLP